MATAVTISKTNNADIDGMLSGYKWSGTISYSFPDAPSDYASPYSGGDNEPNTAGFASAPSQMQAAINYAIGLILGYTTASIQYNGTGSADLMIAQSPAANPTSYAYYPGNYAPGGDIWFGTQYDYTQAKLGNYFFTTALHELGHAFGLKHSQETGGVANVAVPSAHDDLEYTLMSYRSYMGGPLTGYTNEAYGYPQTYMANDILALQTLYGANFTTHRENTVYSWSPTTGQEFINGAAQLAPGNGAGGSANRIFETIWDGNGIDTYDLSNYTTAVSINLNPGASSITSTTQLAYLGNGHYAAGNIYNAYLYSNDARSYIENAIGGSGNDTLIGNVIANNLNGSIGNDTLTGGSGNDTLVGGSGTDVALFSGAHTSYLISYNSATQTFTLTDQRTGSPDGIDTVTGVENFQFLDGTFASATFTTPTVIEAFGSTSLTAVGSSFYLYNSSGSGPVLKYSGAAVVAGQFDPWTPIGAEQTATGYQVAWKVTGSDNYTVWNTDSNGNYTSDTIGVVSGNSYALESLEASFYQDLNGDGVIGVPTRVIEAAGSTSLTEVGTNFYLYSAGSGPSLKMAGVNVDAVQYGAWAPIGAEQTATGYQVAWKVTGSDNYTVWNTDSNGNYTSDTIGVVSGNSYALESLEASFYQDLNGDGVIGVPTRVIEAAGSTSLTEVGANFYLYSAGSGPSLKMAGVNVDAVQYGAWAPIGAEQTATGYQVAWKVTGSDNYTVWNTDSNGNYTSDTIGVVSGNSYALESLEASFHQDLNGDGTLGPVVSSALEQTGTINLTAGGNGTSSAAQSIFQKFGGAGSDTFVFHPNIRADAILGSTGESELGGFSLVTDTNPPAFVSNNARTEQLHPLFQLMDGGHTAINPDDHDGISPINLHVADLNAGNFIIH